MSSILKALKKLENDAPNQDVFIPWPQHIRRKQNGVAGANRTGKIKKTASLIAVLLIIFASGAVWFREKLAKKPPEVVKPDTVIEEKLKPEKASAGLPRNPKQIQQAEPPVSASSQSPKGVTPTKPPVGTSLTQRRVMSAKPPDKSYQGKKFASFKKVQPGPIEKDTKPSKLILKSDPAEKSDAIPETKSSSIEQMEGTRLKLDAIAWSDDPKKRIAVVNGRIVREGESIEGYVILRIDAEEIIIRQGGKSWRLVFRIH